MLTFLLKNQLTIVDGGLWWTIFGENINRVILHIAPTAATQKEVINQCIIYPYIIKRRKFFFLLLIIFNTWVYYDAYYIKSRWHSCCPPLKEITNVISTLKDPDGFYTAFTGSTVFESPSGGRGGVQV